MAISKNVRDVLPAPLVLSQDEVHVWWSALDQPVSTLQALSQTLAVDERMRAERFCSVRDRQHFIACRAMLRSLLAGYLNIEPVQVRFGYGAHGKPALAADFSDSTIRFNVSHSHGFALFAFTRERKIGVDLEQIRPVSDVQQIVERYFSCRECAVFRSLPSTHWLERFFDWWTCKEAYLKAIGDGLAYPLDHVDVSLVSGEPAMLLHIDSHGPGAARWSLRPLTLVPGYAAALVVEGDRWQLIDRYWSVKDFSAIASLD